jgi:hypothetical protein
MSSAAIAYVNEVPVGGVGLSVGPPGYTIYGGSLADLADQQLSTALVVQGEAEGLTLPRLWLLYTPPAPIDVDVIGVLKNATVTGSYAGVMIKIELLIGAAVVFGWEKGSNPFPISGFVHHDWFVLPTTVAGVTSVRVTLRHTSGVNDTYTIGALWIGPLYKHPVGIDADWSMQVSDPGQMGLSKGAQGYPQLRQKTRIFSGLFGPVDLVSTYGDPATPNAVDIQALQYRLGTTAFCVLFPRVEDSAGAVSEHLIHRLGIYGAFRDIGSIRHLSDDNYSWGPVTFQELL